MTHISRPAIFYIFAVIFIEGYLVLSTEILALRSMLPFVGGGTDTVSIIISAVLLPLAAGYYKGGQFKPYINKNGESITLRKKLSKNILIATIFILLGLSFLSITAFMESVLTVLTINRLLVTTLYAAIFIVTPVYLLGQTTPLLSTYFSDQKLPEVTGKILFISTIGSFIGATATTLILMAYIGVHYTVLLNIILASLLYVALNKPNQRTKPAIIAAIMVLLATAMNAGPVLSRFHVVENNAYSTVTVKKSSYEDINILSINNTPSSTLDSKGQPALYAKFIYDSFIRNIPGERLPADILVIGAGGFGIGTGDTMNKYDFIDIDPDLKDTTETYFTKEKLTPNKHFHAVPARGFLTRSSKKYDLVILDVFLGNDMPEQLVTREFFEQVRDAMKQDGFMVLNIVTSPTFNSAFSRNFDKTIRSVFPQINRQIIGDMIYLWNPDQIANIIYMSPYPQKPEPTKIYTDEKNSSYRDRPKKIWRF